MYLNMYYYNKVSKKGASIRCHPSELKATVGETDVEIGIDQSGSNVGFYILDRADKFHVIGNVTRSSSDSLQVFMYGVEVVFKTLLQKAKVRLFVREKPLPYAGDRASKVLYEVAKYFDNWTNPSNFEMPMFSDIGKTSTGKIYPNVWRKHIIDKSKGKGRSTDKLAVVEDLLDLYPEFTPYMKTLPMSSDYDGFEALGILLGYKKEHGIKFSDSGVAISTVLSGDREYLGHIALFYKLFNSVDETSFSVDVANLLRKNEVLPVMELNPDKSLYDNYRISASTYDVSLLVVTDQTVIKSLQMLYKVNGYFANLGVLCIKNRVLNEGYRNFLRQKYLFELQTWF